MSNRTIRGKIEDSERFEKYDDEGLKFIQYWIQVNNQRYTVRFARGKNFYFELNEEVVLYVTDEDVAIAGICPKKSFEWGNTKPIRSEVGETDRFELAVGSVLEKRKESITSYTGTAVYYSNVRKVETYTIVLPETSFRVHRSIGRHILPNREISALLDDGVAYIVQDHSTGKIYGKPRLDFIIAIVLLLAFNGVMLFAVGPDSEVIAGGFLTTMIIGNLLFGLGFLFSFSGYLSSSKSLSAFKELLAARELRREE